MLQSFAKFVYSMLDKHSRCKHNVMPNLIQGTSTIGSLYKDEVECRTGETLTIQVDVPQGTAGLSFVSNFRHELLHQGLPIDLDPGVFAEGSFAVSIANAKAITLTTPTDWLLPGRYVFDIAAVGSSETKISRLRSFVLSGALSTGPGSVLPPQETTAGLVKDVVDSTVDDLQLLSKGKYTVSQASLIGGYATITLSSNTSDVVDVAVYDSFGKLDLPWQQLSSTVLTIDFANLVPLTENYTVYTVHST